MLKKLPKARVEIESDDDRGSRWLREQEDALTDEEYEQLRCDIWEKALPPVRDAVYEAVKATAGKPGVLLLESHAKRLDELARAEADYGRDRAAYQPTTLPEAWVRVVEAELWGAYSYRTVRDRSLGASSLVAQATITLPAQSSLVRLVFPEFDEDFAALEDRAPHKVRNYFEKYDFDNFVVSNSSLDYRTGESHLHSLCSNCDTWNYFMERWDELTNGKTNYPEFPPLITLHLSAKREIDVLASTSEINRADFTDGPPVILNDVDGETFWFHHDSIYVTEEDLEPDDVLALINEKENKKRSKLDKARDLQAMRDEDEGGKPAKAGKAGKKTRKSIPEDVRHAVWRRDEGKCVDCDSQQELEFDHIIPLAMGGSNTERNLQLLCADCNRRKGATLG